MSGSAGRVGAIEVVMVLIGVMWVVHYRHLLYKSEEKSARNAALIRAFERRLPFKTNSHEK